MHKILMERHELLLVLFGSETKKKNFFFIVVSCEINYRIPVPVRIGKLLHFMVVSLMVLRQIFLKKLLTCGRRG